MVGSGVSLSKFRGNQIEPKATTNRVDCARRVLHLKIDTYLEHDKVLG
jgi:hypothetical protein